MGDHHSGATYEPLRADPSMVPDLKSRRITFWASITLNVLLAGLLWALVPWVNQGRKQATYENGFASDLGMLLRCFHQESVLMLVFSFQNFLDRKSISRLTSSLAGSR